MHSCRLMTASNLLTAWKKTDYKSVVSFETKHAFSVDLDVKSLCMHVYAVDPVMQQAACLGVTWKKTCV